MKTIRNTTGRALSLIAVLISLLLGGCANDVDPALKAKKAKLERNIAALQKIIARSASEVAAISARQLVGMDRPGEVQIKEDDKLEIAARTAQLTKDTLELMTVDKEIDRQKMIAPNLLVDVMAEKHYDQVSNPHVFSHNPNPGVSVPVVTPTVTTGHGH